MNILGISAFYHDSAAALVVDGDITAAAQEERFSRKKHDAGFPLNAINYCLDDANLSISDLECIVFYDKPLLKFERLLETYLSFVPDGFRSFRVAMPVWLKEKLYLKTILRKELLQLAGADKTSLPRILFTEHHQSHAASAFYPSPFDQAAILCMDGVGEWATTSVWMGDKNSLTPLWQIDFPHSLGLLYSAFTYFTGFKVNSGEYKLMGLAPYGEPRFRDVILEHMLDLKDDGTFRMDMSYFDYPVGLKMTNRRFNELFEGYPRKPEEPVTQREMDIAASIQKVVEEVVVRLARTVRQETGSNNLCLAGGVALNCVANGRLFREKIFDDIWIQPAAGDAGGSIGAAMTAYYEYLAGKRESRNTDMMKGSYLGPEYADDEIVEFLESSGAIYAKCDDSVLFSKVAEILSGGNVVGWFQGRMEFGPRALGGRSILGDPRSKKMQSIMNLKIKYRESFRPFAPSVLYEDVNKYFDLDASSPYMLLVADVNEELRIPVSEEDKNLFGIDKLNIPRSTIPAVTHVDHSARIQTVHEDTNPRYHELIRCFREITGIGVLVNTSFNVRGEPIVCTPEDAYRCFMRTEMDNLVIGNYLLSKKEQPDFSDKGSWRDEFEPD